MDNLPDQSVDMILCDLPYGCLNKSNPGAKWDCVIPFDQLWKQYERIAKDTSAILLFGNGMFTAKLMMSNPRLWKYNWTWKKGNRPTGFLNAKKQPLRITEDICVFYKKQPVYHPQFTTGQMCHTRGKQTLVEQVNNNCYGIFDRTPTVLTNEKYPLNLIDVAKEHPQKYHPTQKPVALLEYLIRTYTNEGQIVLDNCMGSGSTGVACMRTNRNFVGMELDENYYNTAKKRIEEVTNQHGS